MRGSTGLGVMVLLAFVACGGDDDDGGTEADKRGVGAACGDSTDCKEAGQTCLTFKGGYCGVADCTADLDCPSGSRCVAHTDGKNYCFRVCFDKFDCNRNRPAEHAANCSANITFVESGKSEKACVPPSS